MNGLAFTTISDENLSLKIITSISLSSGAVRDSTRVRVALLSDVQLGF